MARQVKKVPIGKQGSGASKEKSSKSSHANPHEEAKHKSEHKSEHKSGHEAHVSDHTKHSAQKGHSKKSPKKRQSNPWISRISLALLLIVAGFLLFFEMDLLETEDKGPVAARVNGEDIYASEVEQHFAQVPQQMRQGMTKDVVLDQIITQELLVQKADEIGVSVSDDELDAEIDAAMDQAGWSEEEFNEILSSQGMDREELEDLYRVSIVIDNLIEQEVLGDIEVTEEDAREYFEDNKDQFVPQEDEVRAQQILISTEQRTSEEALEIAEEVRERALDGENFTELAREYSDDPSVEQNDGDLGFFSEGMMVPEFEEVAFAMEEVGDISEPVSTDFGYHIVKLLDKRSAGAEPNFEELSSQIENQLLDQTRMSAVESYIKDLREDADIERLEVEEVDLPEAPQQQGGGGQPIEISEEELEELEDQMGEDSGAQPVGGDDTEVEIQ